MPIEKNKKTTSKVDKSKKSTSKKTKSTEEKLIEKNTKRNASLENKRKRVTYEKERIEKELNLNDSQKKRIAKNLIEDAAYLSVSMKELRNDIDKEGHVVVMQQGDYCIDRENPKVKIYNNYLQRYTTIMDKILSLLPREELKVVEKEDDGFDSFAEETIRE